MKAPEKLYIDSREHWRKSWTAFTTKAKGDDIEYIKKDAFIEKACEWLNKESESYVKTGGVGACVTYEGLDVKELVEDFEKYMEGE